MSITLNTPSDMMQQIAERFHQRRLSLSLSREGLAARSGVNASSLKRFERSGKIAFESLLKLALTLDLLNDFDAIGHKSFASDNKSLDELLKSDETKKRGRLK